MGSEVGQPLTPVEALTPKQRLALEMYTNPLYGRTFGNKLASARAAGYSTGGEDGKKDARLVFESASMKEALAYVEQLQDERGEDVIAYFERYSMDAAYRVVQQLGLDADLEPKPMPEGLLDKPATPIIGKDKAGNEVVIGYDNGHLQQAKEITNYNNSVVKMAREVREAAKLVLAYHVGTPEYRAKNGGDERDPLNLGDLDDAQLRDLARHVAEVRDMRAGGTTKPPTPEEEPRAVVVEGDFEVLS